MNRKNSKKKNVLLEKVALYIKPMWWVDILYRMKKIGKI